MREPVPLIFPTDEEVPEHKLHVELRTALYQLIQLALGDHVIVGSEQFVYFDAANPQRRLAPDVMVWVGAKDEIFGAWKVWERGAPHVAVEQVQAMHARAEQHGLFERQGLARVDELFFDFFFFVARHAQLR